MEQEEKSFVWAFGAQLLVLAIGLLMIGAFVWLSKRQKEKERKAVN